MVKVEVFGAGCPKCKRMYKNADQAVKEMGIKTEVIKVEDIDEILKRGIMMTPALVVDGEKKVVGRVPGVEEIKKLMTEAQRRSLQGRT